MAYLGPRGTFSEEALFRLFPAGEVDPQPCRSIADAVFEAAEGRADAAFVPIENSLEGSVNLTLDLLVHEVDLSIQGEVLLPVRQHLAARPGTALAQVRRVYSHPHALPQCRRLLRELAGVEVQTSASTAEAARRVATEEGAAAICNALAVEIYHLAVLRPDVQDSPNNVTRFVLLGRGQPDPTGRDKTSVVFTLREDRPGALCDALAEFARRQINLSKLETRPTKAGYGSYLFFADLEGHRSEPRVAEALAAVRRRCSFWKELGSYPRAFLASEERTRRAPPPGG